MFTERFPPLFLALLSLSFLIKYLKKHPLDIFAYYRIILALVILLFELQRN